MRPHHEELTKKLKNRETIFGTHVFAGMPILTEAIAQIGFDLIWLDMEHTGIGIESVVNNMIAARSGGTTTWVRVPWNDPVLAKPVLDMGADGIIFPMVKNAKEAKLAVEACAYPNSGVRGYGPLRALDYGAITQMEYVHNTYKECHKVIQIEHVDAVKNLSEIADVEGIDAFIVGPNDLSASIGLIGEINHPKVKKLYEEIARVLTAKKKPFGVSIGYNEENIKYWLSLGANIIFCGTDVDYVYRGAKTTLDGFKSIVK